MLAVSNAPDPDETDSPVVRSRAATEYLASVAIFATVGVVVAAADVVALDVDVVDDAVDVAEPELSGSVAAWVTCMPAVPSATITLTAAPSIQSFRDFTMPTTL